MAEAFARKLGEGVVAAASAGLFPASIIQPETFQVMGERGARVEDRPPLSILGVDGAQVDLIVNMSGQRVAGFLRGFEGREVDWEVSDPIGRSLAVYRAVRDDLEKRVAALIEELRR